MSAENRKKTHDSDIASTDDLFAVCADHYGCSEPVARVV
jgi:hypothetical protein